MNTKTGKARGSITTAQWRIVILCALAQNCTMGFAFGSFGPLLTSTEEHFGVSRSAATMGMSAIMLAIGLLSPVLGNLLQRIGVRTGMALGVLLSALCYWGLALTHSFALAMVLFCLIGVGTCLGAILGPLTLVSRWFTDNRGKMLSLINLPILLFLTPYAIGGLLPVFGREALLSGLGYICLAVAILTFFLPEHPPLPAHKNNPQTAPDNTAAGTLEPIFKRAEFWLLSIGIGIMAGAGTGFVVHVVPFGISKDLTLQAASALLSVYAAAGIAGTLFFGWLCDRIGPPSALTINASVQALLWWSFLHAGGLPLYVIAAALGICMVPLVMMHGAAVSQMFGAATVSRAMGYSYSIKLPFIFTFAPTIALMYESFGDYNAPFLATAALLATAGAAFYLMQRTLKAKQTVAAIPG